MGRGAGRAVAEATEGLPLPGASRHRPVPWPSGQAVPPAEWDWCLWTGLGKKKKLASLSGVGVWAARLGPERPWLRAPHPLIQSPPWASHLFSFRTCAPLSAVEHSCDPAPPLPSWVAYQDPGTPERAQLRSPFSQSGKVGREPGPAGHGPSSVGLGEAGGLPPHFAGSRPSQCPALWGPFICPQPMESMTRLRVRNAWPGALMGGGGGHGQQGPWNSSSLPSSAGRADAVPAPLQSAPSSCNPSLGDGATSSLREPRDSLK